MPLPWSAHVRDCPPELLPPEEVGNLRDRAYPYADTPPPHLRVEDRGAPPVSVDGKFIVVLPTNVTFYGQRGPVREVGVNGCQIDDMIVFALGTIEAFNDKFHHEANDRAIAHLRDALGALEARRLEREARGVEGLDKE